MEAKKHRKRFVEILRKIFRTKTPEQIYIILESCSVSDIWEKCKRDLNSDIQYISMFKALSEGKADNSEENALSTFFVEYLEIMPGNIGEADEEFLKYYLENRSKLRAHSGAVPVSPGRALSGARCRSDVSDLDLRKMVGDFIGPFDDPEGVFGFSIGNISNFVIQEYILYRLECGYRQQIKHPFDQRRFDISIHDESEKSLKLQTALEKDIVSAFDDMLAENDGRDMFFKVWNCDIEKEIFAPMVENAWQALLSRASRLKGTGRCFVSMWMNDQMDPVKIEHERFTVLKPPEKFEESHSSDLKKTLEGKGIDDETVRKYVDGFKSLKHKPEQAYFFLHGIFCELQGA